MYLLKENRSDHAVHEQFYLIPMGNWNRSSLIVWLTSIFLFASLYNLLIHWRKENTLCPSEAIWSKLSCYSEISPNEPKCFLTLWAYVTTNSLTIQACNFKFWPLNCTKYKLYLNNKETTGITSKTNLYYFDFALKIHPLSFIIAGKWKCIKQSSVFLRYTRIHLLLLEREKDFTDASLKFLELKIISSLIKKSNMLYLKEKSSVQISIKLKYNKELNLSTKKWFKTNMTWWKKL